MAVKDYEIVIKYPYTESNNKTLPTPDDQKPTTPEMPTDDGGNGGGVDIPDSPISITKGGSISLKALTGLAKIKAIIMVAKTAVRIADTIIPYQAGYTGDTTLEKNWANAKSVVNLLNPISAINSSFTQTMEMYRENLKTEELRKATGNSVINVYGGKTSN